MYPSARGRTGSIALWLVLLPTLVLFGALLAVAPPVAAMLLLGGGSAVLALVVPLPWLLAVTFVASALLGGAAEYFLHLSQLNWLPFILSAIAAARAMTLSQMTPRGAVPAMTRTPGLALFLYPTLLYFTVLFASSAGNVLPAAQAFTAMKNYLLMWGIFVCFLYLGPVERASTLLWRLVLVIAAVQLPVVAYQKFFVASKLGGVGVLSYDAINGTFGGGLTGGRSGALAMFIAIAWGYALICWRDRVLSFGRFFLYSLVALPSVFLMEVKAIVFWLPLVALLVLFARVRQRPVLFVSGVAASLLLAVAVVVVYRTMYYAPSSGGSLHDFFTRDLAYVYDPDRFSRNSRELGRFSALVHWWREVDFSSLSQWLIGFGPGASRGISTVAVGTVAQKYPFYIDISAAAALLWDTGVLGLAAFCSMLGLGSLEARRLSKLASLPAQLRRELEASQIALLLILSSVFYVRDAIDGSTIQFVIFFVLGVVVYARRLAGAEGARVPASSRDARPAFAEPARNGAV